MNKQRRAELTAIAEELADLKDRLETCKNEEEQYLENMPENLRDSEKHEQAEETVATLDTAVDSLEEVFNAVDEVINN